MITINTFDDVVKTNIPKLNKITGHVIGDRAIVSFGRMGDEAVYGYRLFEFDKPIENNRVDAEWVKTSLVNPDYFVYQNEEYKIEE